MNASEYLSLKVLLVEKGYGEEAKWANDVKLCDDPDVFAYEAVWVVLSAGMKNQVVEGIYRKMIEALQQGKPLLNLFRHKSKVKAIEYIWKNRGWLFSQFQQVNSENAKLAFLNTLPWIGDITKYHLARNLGLDFCKPDRHLVRIARGYSMTPEELCHKLAKETGERIGVVDVVLWRAANLGII